MTAARPTIYLCIGAMKSGATFLQKLMFANQDNLRAAGCLVAGESTHEQALAARDILRGASIADPRYAPSARGDGASCGGRCWPTRDPRCSPWSSSASPTGAKAERVVGRLAGADVHVVLTVRDAARALVDLRSASLP